MIVRSLGISYFFLNKMIIKKEFSQDVLYKIKLCLVNGCMEYCLVDANEHNNIYAIFEEEKIKE